MSRNIQNQSHGSKRGRTLLSFMCLIIIFLLFTQTVKEEPKNNVDQSEEISNNEAPIKSIPLRTSTRSQPEYSDLVSYDDVLVIRNLNSAMSMQIADYFQAKRNIPQINICNISTSTSETISRTVFENEIRTPIEDHILNNGLLGDINFIVTTKGVPLRISEVDTSDDGIYAWDRACLDSDLALILGFYSNNIGDPYWINNPIFDPSEYQEFTYQSNGFFLVTRLTGYTWEDIKAMIDRVEIAAGEQGTFYFDVDPGKDDGGGYQEGNDWMRAANATLTANSFDVVLDETTLFMTNNISAAGYTSWGSNDANYPKNSILNPGFENDGNGDYVPDNWYFVNDTGSCEMNDTENRSGAWSVKIERGISGDGSTFVAQNYTVKPETRYYATGFANLSGVSSDMGAHLQIRAYDSGNNLVAFYNGTTRTGTTGSWVSLGQVHFEPIPGVTDISFAVVLSKSTGEVFFDDVRLYEIKPHNQWIPGALAETYVSTGGRSFNYPTGYGQSLVADIIRDGVTGIKGYVYEPFLSAIAHPDILFDAYTQGYNLAESYYMASAFLSWMDVVVGDPKLAPYNPDILSDLTLVSGNITFSDPTPQTGSSIDIYASIENKGPTNAQNVEVEFFVGDPETGILLGSKTLDILGWESNSTSILWDTTGYLDDYNITVVIDPLNTIFESNETNNNASRTITINTGYPSADAGSNDMVNEDSIYVFDGSGSTDNSTIINLTWDFDDGTYGYGMGPSHTYTQSGIYQVTLNVTNNYGLWDMDLVEITVSNVVPTADAGNNKVDFEGVELSFDASGSTDTPSDIPFLNYTWYFGDGNTGYGINPWHTYQDDGFFVVTLEVRDDDGALDTDSLNVDLDNVAPQITPVPSQILYEDTLFQIDIIASDVSQDMLTYSDNTTLFDIDSATGEISFLPENADVGDYMVRIAVADEDGGASFIDIQIRIENTNDPPQIISTPVTQAQEGLEYEYIVLVEDDDLDIPVSEEIYYSLDDFVTGMTIDSSGKVTWYPEETHVSQFFSVAVNVSDGEEFDVQIYLIYVNNINDIPRITSSPVTQVYEDSTYYYDVEAEDEDMGDTLTFSLKVAPLGMSIDSSSGEISWLCDNSDVGKHNVTVNVTDSQGAYEVQEFILTVTNTNDAPTLNPIGDLVAKEDELFEFQAIASDEDSNDDLRFSDDTNLFEIDGDFGIISFIPENDDVGEHTVVITVRDEAGSMDSETIKITITNSNDPPTLDFFNYWQLREDELFSESVKAEDVDEGDILTFLDNTTLFDIDPQTGEISFVPTNDDVGRWSVNISVMDKNGDFGSINVIFFIKNENDPPEIDRSSIPGSNETIKIRVGETFELTVTAEDIDLEDSLTFSDDTHLFNIDRNTGEIILTPSSKDAGTHEVKITVTDGEGETDFIYLTFEIKDEEKEKLNLIWIILPVIIVVILVLILFLVLMRKKGKPNEDIVEFEERQPDLSVQPRHIPPPPPPNQ